MCKCKRCNHEWVKRTKGKPVACPNCKGMDWDKKGYTNKVTRKRKKKVEATMDISRYRTGLSDYLNKG